MAEKFPKLSKESSDCLREFLTAPSQILARLSRHYNRIENYVNSNSNNKKSNLPALTVTESSESIKSIKQYADGPDRKYNASWQAFEKLRDCAIYNLCRSIRAQLIGELIYHPSEIKGLCLMKLSWDTLQNLPYFWNKKTEIFFALFISCIFGFDRQCHQA